MTTHASYWREISAPSASSDGVVLCLDYDSVLRPEAGFEDLAALVEDGSEWRVLTGASLRPSNAYEWVESAAREVRSWEQRVVAILGYCAGGMLVGPLYRALSCPQTLTAAFDPDPVTARTLTETLGSGTVEGASDLAITCLADHCVALYVEELRQQSMTRGLTRAELCALRDSHVGLMNYLSAIHDLPEVMSPERVLLSPGREAPRGWAGESTPVSHEDLLSDPSTARTLRRWIESPMPRCQEGT